MRLSRIMLTSEISMLKNRRRLVNPTSKDCPPVTKVEMSGLWRAAIISVSGQPKAVQGVGSGRDLPTG